MTNLNVSDDLYAIRLPCGFLSPTGAWPRECRRAEGVQPPSAPPIGGSTVCSVRWTCATWTSSTRRGFGDPAGFGPQGQATGAGWRSVFTLATGIQYQWTDCISTRIGYIFTQNSIPDDTACFNAARAAIYQHLMGVGSSYAITPNFNLSLAWVRVFPHLITGPFLTPAGPIPGSAVRIDQFADLIEIGLSAHF
jgi:hypothetical protein